MTTVVCPTHIRLTCIRLLQVEQLAFEVEASTVSAERTARCDHPVARDDDRDRIPIVRHADGTVGMSVADGFSNVAVTAGLSIRDCEQRVPARKLEFGSPQIQRKRKLAALAFEVFVEFAEVGRERGFGLLQLSRIGI